MLSIPALSIFIPLCQPSNQRTFHSKRFSGACDSNKMLWCSGSGVLVKTCQNQQPQFFHAGTIKTQCWFQRESIGAWHIFVLLVQFLFGPSILTGFLPRLTVNKASFNNDKASTTIDKSFYKSFYTSFNSSYHSEEKMEKSGRNLGEIWDSLELFMGDGTLHLSQVIQTPEASRLRAGVPMGVPMGLFPLFSQCITVYQQCITTEYHQKLPWENYLEYLKQPLLKSKSRLTRGCSENVDLRQAPLAIPNAAMPCIRKIKAVTRDTFSKTFSDGFFLHVTP